jgi:UDP-N-acetylmuramyl pentapeptide phosphotransferase/UDP-N-acetylglucosamine-1-phosphate transferase
VRETPRGGGIVVVGAVLSGLAALAITGTGGPPSAVAAFAAISIAVAAVGWRDDLRSLAPMVRFAVHVLAAAAAIAVWGTFDRLHLPGVGLLILPTWVAVALTGLWIVGLINAYNFMDGIDGLASAQAVVAGIVWVIASTAHAPLVMTIGALVAGASVGFLWHNRPPARVFLGDAGSGFLGFTFAVLPLIAYQGGSDARLLIAGVLPLWPFVFDTSFTFIRRLVHGENVIRAHRSHLYQRLVLSGWTHGRVAALYTGLAAVGGIVALAWLRA